MQNVYGIVREGEGTKRIKSEIRNPTDIKNVTNIKITLCCEIM